MIRYLVFDFDGTLADTFETVVEIARAEFGEISDEDFSQLRKEGIKSMIRRKEIPAWRLPKIVLRMTSKLADKRNIKLFPQIPDMIGNLKNNYKIGIVSSNSEPNIIQVLEKYGIDDHIGFIFSDSSVFGKHTVLRRMCKKYRINPAEAVYIGDEDRDISAAKKTNIRNIAVTWGYNSEERLRTTEPEFIVNSPDELLQVLNKLM